MHSHNIHSLFSLFRRGEPLSHFLLISILEIFKDFSPTTRKYSKTFHQHPRIFKHFSSAPENIHKLFRLQNCLSRRSSTIFRKNSKTFWAATNSSNHQQQPTTATISSNQQQQPSAAINSSNQHQQSTAAISSNNQLSSYQQHLHNPRRLPLVSTMVPS